MQSSLKRTEAMRVVKWDAVEEEQLEGQCLQGCSPPLAWQRIGRLEAGFQAGQPEDCIPARYFTVRQGLANGRGRPAVDRLQRRVQMARAARQEAGQQGSRGVHLRSAVSE